MTKVGSGLSQKPDSVQAASEAIQLAMKNIGTETPDLVFVFASTAHDYKKVLQEVKSKTNAVNIVGCSTAGEFTEKLTATNSVAVMAVKSDSIKFEVVLADNVKGNYNQVAENVFKDFKDQSKKVSLEGFRYPTVMMVMDGLVGNGEDFVKSIYSKTGILSQIVGGAAADDGKFKETNVFYGTEVHSNAIVFIKMFSKNKVGIGVSHGMKNTTKPMRVTKSIGGILYELDGKPAFDAYKEYAESKGVTLNPENTGNFLINNELAIQDLTFTKIRAPLTPNTDGSLNMATEVPQGCLVTIVGSSESDLVRAAQEAATEAKNNLGDAKAAGIITFDCICRQVIMGANFINEVKAIENVFGENVPVIGFATYGEIARFSGTLNGFHNATAVVCALPE